VTMMTDLFSGSRLTHWHICG